MNKVVVLVLTWNILPWASVPKILLSSSLGIPQNLMDKRNIWQTGTMWVGFEARNCTSGLSTLLPGQIWWETSSRVNSSHTEVIMMSYVVLGLSQMHLPSSKLSVKCKIRATGKAITHLQPSPSEEMTKPTLKDSLLKAQNSGTGESKHTVKAPIR